MGGITEHEALASEYQNVNSKLLYDFTRYLAYESCPRSQIDEHERNLDFYLNHYLLYREPLSAREGVRCDLVGDFLGNFFVHKAMWTDLTEQKSTIQSLLRFYAWMAELHNVDQGEFDALRDHVEREQEQWFSEMERYAETNLEAWQHESEIDIPEDFYTEESEPEGESDENEDIDLENFVVPGLDDGGEAEKPEGS